MRPRSFPGSSMISWISSTAPTRTGPAPRRGRRISIMTSSPGCNFALVASGPFIGHTRHEEQAAVARAETFGSTHTRRPTRRSCPTAAAAPALQWAAGYVRGETISPFLCSGKLRAGALAWWLSATKKYRRLRQAAQTPSARYAFAPLDPGRRPRQGRSGHQHLVAAERAVRRPGVGCLHRQPPLDPQRPPRRGLGYRRRLVAILRQSPRNKRASATHPTSKRMLPRARGAASMCG